MHLCTAHPASREPIARLPSIVIMQGGREENHAIAADIDAGELDAFSAQEVEISLTSATDTSQRLALLEAHEQ